MSRTRLTIITISVMLALFLAAVELTVVGTAMPTIISQLGGLAAYSWVFSVYSLASTMMTPIFGKLSDQFGRRPVFLVGMAIFLVGSALSGLSQSMTQLILFRTVQGLGAGALIPLSFTIVGDVFTVQQRTRIQGLFSGVWGVASLIGPLVGGFLVDNASWRWVFYINLPFGLLAMTMLYFSLNHETRPSQRTQIDYPGAILLSISIVSLLLAILEGGRQWAWLSAPTFILLSVAVVGFVLLLRAEQRAAEPILALDLFGDRVFQVTAAHGFLAGLALFGSTSFVPLFAQAVLGASATVAGATLTPQLIGWVLTSTLGAPIILRAGYRRISIVGMTIMLVGAWLMAQQGSGSSAWSIGVSQFLFGGGMGITITTMVIAAQNRVVKSRLGVTTSMLTFMRTIGGSIGVSLMGAVMAATLASGLAALPGGAAITPESLLDPIAARQIPPQALESAREALAAALHPVFLIALAGTALGLVTVFFMPRGSVEELSAPAQAGQTSGHGRADAVEARVGMTLE